jgi:O-antigen ligase
VSTGLLLLAAAAPLLILFALAAIRRPLEIALPAYVLMLPFGSGLSTGVPSAFGSLSSILGVLLTVSLAGQLITARRGPPNLPASVPVWLAFVALAGVSMFWSIAPQMTIRSFAVLVSLAVLYMLLVLSRVDPPTLVRVENAVLLGAVIAVGYGLTQLLLLGGLPSTPEGSGRFGNGLLGPNNQAAAMLLPLAIATTRASARHRLIDRGFHAAVAVLLLIGILMTGSRGGLLAALVTLVLVVLLVHRGRRMMVVLGGLIVAVTIAVLVVNPAGIGARQVKQQQSSSGRAEIWSIAMHACPTYCSTGSGWGTFPRVYQLERASVPDARVLRRGTSFEPHNLWVLALIEAGLAGAVIMTIGLLLALRDALLTPISMRAPPVAAIAGTIVAGVFLSNLEFKFFWMVLAYATMARSSGILDVRSQTELRRDRSSATNRRELAKE